MNPSFVDALDEDADPLELNKDLNMRAVVCPRCNAPAGFACTNLAEGPVWDAGWSHHARVMRYLVELYSHHKAAGS